MLEAIPAAEVALSGKALEVRYKETPGRPGLLTVSVLAHAVEGGPDHVRRSELALVVADERMGSPIGADLDGWLTWWMQDGRWHA